MNHNPNEWPNHLLWRIIEDRTPAFLAIDKNGFLKNWGGHIDIYGLLNLKKQPLDHHKIPCLMGLFPTNHSHLVLEGVETPSGRPADIHLLSEEDLDWIFFLDASKQIELQKQAQQAGNELRLLRTHQGQSWVQNLAGEHHMAEIDLASIFKALDVLVLTYGTNNTFERKGALPTWCPTLFPQAIQREQGLKPQDQFPMLECFVSEAIKHWDQHKKTRLRSGIWYETLPDGTTCLMEATALRVNDQPILLIEKLDGLGDERQYLIQQGRDQQLLFQKEMTRQKQLTEKLKEAKDTAEATTQQKSEVLANMSHELRTPLTSIIGFSEILEDQLSGPVDEKHFQYLHNIVSSGEYLLRLINSVLDLARLDAGRQEVYQDTVNLTHMLRDVTQNFEAQVWNRPVELKTEIPNTIDTIDTDADKLRQILVNLVGNAVKFTTQGHVIVRVITKENKPSCIEVTDTGPGIPEDQHAEIFEAFQQVGKRDKKGTGLGLTITKALCEVLGYRLTMDSKVGQGTTFSIDLKPEKEE